MAPSDAPAGTRAPTALFAGMVDDAAMFPPARLPVAAAVDAHRTHRAAWYAPYVGPLLCAAHRAGELSATLADRWPHGEEALRVAWIVRPGVADPLADLGEAMRVASGDPRLVVVGVEAPAAAVTPQAVVGQVGSRTPVWMEVDRRGPWRATLDTLATLDGPVRAKLRTGGLEAAAFPSVDELAAFVHHAVVVGVAFKCTAGLHHAVRHADAETGVVHHGVLNLLSAVAAAVAGAPVARLVALLRSRDATALAAGVRDLTPAAAAVVRAAFRSFGCCAVTEPIEELAALGLVDRPA